MDFFLRNLLFDNVGLGTLQVLIEKLALINLRQFLEGGAGGEAGGRRGRRGEAGGGGGRRGGGGVGDVTTI